MKLAFCESGGEFEIVNLICGTGLLRRLGEMGIYPGVKVSIVSNYGFGPIILGINSTRIGIGRGIAMKIVVRPIKRKEQVI
jgi:ferrous iron transport protein A